MDSGAKYFVSTLVILVVLTVGFVGYEYYSLQRMSEQFNAINERLDNSVKTLEQDIDSRSTALEKKTEVLKADLTSSVEGLSTSISETEKKAAAKFTGLEGKISSVEEESKAGFEDLEDKLINLNLKSQDFSLIVEKVLDSVVSIVTDKGIGSGAIVDRDGYAVTNFHVVDDISQAAARTYDGERYSIRLVAVNEDQDLALIQLSGGDSFKALEFERSSKVNVGQRVIALGSPAGLDFSVTEGIVSAVGRSNSKGVQFIQTDVPINPGNSGGPLVNIQKEIVGINTMKTQGFEGLGFAIEADTVSAFVQEVIAADKAAQAE